MITRSGEAQISRPIYDLPVDVIVGPGWVRVVEQVLVQLSLSRPPKPMLRVRHGTYFGPTA